MAWRGEFKINALFESHNKDPLSSSGTSIFGCIENLSKNGISSFICQVFYAISDVSIFNVEHSWNVLHQKETRLTSLYPIHKDKGFVGSRIL